MAYDALDHILSREEEIFSSAGFSARVMDVVRSEASAPPPIAFPWKRAWPGLAAAGFALVLVLAGLAKVAREALAAPSSVVGPPLVEPLVRTVLYAGVGPVILALLVSLASVKLSLHLTAG
jgi:hypothetical protein